MLQTNESGLGQKRPGAPVCSQRNVLTVRIRSIGCNHLESVRLLPVVTGGRVRGGGGIYDCRRKKNAKGIGNTSVFRRILVPVDFSYASRRALAVPTSLAPADAKLSVAHVMNTDWRYEMLENPPEIDLERHDAKDKLSALVGEFDGDRKIDSLLVRHGPIAQAILALAGEEAADLIVVGTHGRGGLSKLALGSVAEELLRISPNPVMTVGPKAEITPGLPLFQTILFATDFGKGSTTALPLVLAMAAHYKAKLILDAHDVSNACVFR